jgi:hypothetical protein
MYPKGDFPGRPSTRHSGGGGGHHGRGTGGGGGGGVPPLPSGVSKSQYWVAQTGVARAIRNWRQALRADAAAVPKQYRHEYSALCWEGDYGGCQDNKKFGRPKLSTFIEDEMRSSVEQEVPNAGEWPKGDLQKALDGTLGAWRVAISEKQAQIAAQLGTARSKFDTAVNAGRLLDARRANDEIGRLNRQRRAGDASALRMRLLKGLERGSSAAGFLMDVSHGVSLGRAAARAEGGAEGALGGARLGLSACGPVCAAYGGVLGAYAGPEIADAFVDKFNEVTNLPEIKDDLCPGGDCFPGID